MDPIRSRCCFFLVQLELHVGQKIATYEDHVNMQKVKECNPPNDYSHKVARKRK